VQFTSATFHTQRQQRERERERERERWVHVISTVSVQPPSPRQCLPKIFFILKGKLVIKRKH
jgi:hypothetical protein